MQDSMYNGLFGALTQEYRMNIIANNLANVNTSGFKEDKLAFKDVLLHYAHDLSDPRIGIRSRLPWPEQDQLTQPRIDEERIDFRQGGIIQTGNPLDLAIQGPGFFKVRTPAGDFYTRQGKFQLAASGQIVTAGGAVVLGENGPLAVNEQGKVVINKGGQVFVGDRQVGKILVVELDNSQDLEKRGNALLQMRAGVQAQERAARNSSVYQGGVEQSNVSVVGSMVQMIETLRTFEACQKVMSSTNDEDIKLINKLGEG